MVASDRSGFITLATGDMKSTKRSGPRTEPWGTPVDIVVEGEDDESILTKDERFVRHICVVQPPVPKLDTCT